MTITERVKPLCRYVPLLAWVLVVSTVLIIPLKIIGHGYTPGDDANRHVAKVISGKDWTDILVLREGVIHDHNAGWHAVLGFVYRHCDMDADALIAFSVVGLLALVLGCGLPWFHRPEALIGALFLASISYLTALIRYTYGRPFLFSTAVLVTVLALWTRVRPTHAPWLRYAATTLLLALATWIHGSWYLFLLPIAAFVLAGRIRAAAALFGCFLIAQPIGAAFTGEPIAFLSGHIANFFSCLGSDTPQKLLVAEFQPSDGAPGFVPIVLCFLLWRRLRGLRIQAVLRDPVFVMGLIGYVLGFHVVRLWADWGLPAMILWMAFELEQGLTEHHAEDAPGRLVYVGLTCLALFLACTTDRQGRWTRNLHTEYLEQDNVELAGWLPEDGGVIYSDNMRVFYDTFFKNPRADWRYILGFEPSFMPKEDLETYRRIQWNSRDARAFEPWVRKMHPEDRLVFSSPKSDPPSIEGLEWHYAATDCWIGRVPREIEASETVTSSSPAPGNAAAASES